MNETPEEYQIKRRAIELQRDLELAALNPSERIAYLKAFKDKAALKHMIGRGQRKRRFPLLKELSSSE